MKKNLDAFKPFPISAVKRTEIRITDFRITTNRIRITINKIRITKKERNKL